MQAMAAMKATCDPDLGDEGDDLDMGSEGDEGAEGAKSNEDDEGDEGEYERWVRQHILMKREQEEVYKKRVREAWLAEESKSIKASRPVPSGLFRSAMQVVKVWREADRKERDKRLEDMLQ